MKSKKTLYIAVMLILIAIIGFVQVNKNERPNMDRVVVGAVLSMTGPSAIYGEQLKVGMEYALRDLDPNHTIELKIADSKGEAQAGISAFNVLKNDGADIFISNFSRVSMPLRDLVKKENKPLIMTLVSAMSAVDSSTPTNIRVFHNAETVVGAHMKTVRAKGFKSVGLIYVKDEFGVSLHDSLKRQLEGSGISFSAESFTADQNDFRTQIQKMKSRDVDVIMFATIPPISLANFLRQNHDLGINIPIIDVTGIIAGTGAIKTIGDVSEGVYSFATPFDIGQTGGNIRSDLKHKNMDSTYPVAFGYDVMKYIIQARDIALSKNIPLSDAITQIESLEGLQGVYEIKGPEVLPRAIPVQFIGGKFMEVK